MNTLTQLLNSASAQHIAVTLLHSLWQGGLIALLLAIALRLIPLRRPNLRYTISCAAFAMVVITSAITFTLQQDFRRTRHPEIPVTPSRVQPTETLPIAPANLPSLTSAETHAPRDLPAPLIVSIWALGVILFAVYHIAGWLWLQRLRQFPTEEDRWRPIVRRLSDQLHLSRAVVVIESARVAGPWVVGIFKPIILIPLGIFNDLSPQQIEAIFIHELAHIRRHDYLINLIQASIETLMFYHPAVWWISNQVRQERECCCDDLAAKVCGNPTLYVESLLALEQRRSAPAGLALAAGGGKLVSRVRRILNLPTPQRTTPIRSIAAAAMALTCMMLPLLLSQRVTAQTPSTPTTTSQPAAVGKDEFKDLSPIQPEDLIASKEDYKIGSNDLLQVSITDLVGAGVETVKSARVSEKGEITLPYIGAVKVSDKTDAEAQKAIAKAFSDHNIIHNPQVSVTIAEARGRTFSILGEIARPGQYQITQNDFRVLDALVLGQAKPSNISSFYVIRKTADPKKSRIIQIPMDKLVAGDTTVNIVIRPGDMLMAPQPRKQFVHIVITKDDMKLDNKPISWDDLETRLNAIPANERLQTVIELGVADPAMPYSRYNDASLKLMGLVKKYNLAYYSDTGIERKAATQPAAEAEDVGKPMAAFDVGDKPAYPTLKDFIIKGMGHHDFDADHNVEFVIDVIHADKSKDRRLIHGKQPINMQTGKEEDVTLQPQDRLLVRQKVENSNVNPEPPAAGANANKGFIPLMAFQLTKASPWPSVKAFIAESISNVDYQNAEYRIDVIHPDKSKEIRLVKGKEPVNPQTGKVEDVALKVGDELLLREKTVAEALDRAQPAASAAPAATPVPAADHKR